MAQRGEAHPDDIPAVLAVEGHHGPVVHAVNRAARLLGITPHERIVDMRSLCPHLRVEYGDLAGDLRLMDKLVLWSRRWGPWSVRDGAHSLIVDATGVPHLFGGEVALLADIEAQMARLGLTARPAMAPTWGGAWALARYGTARAIADERTIANMLGALPVNALRLDGACVQLLNRLGLKTIRDIAAIPRLSLARRFNRAALAANPLVRLDQAMGRLAEPVSSEDAPEPVRAIVRLPEPIQDPTNYIAGSCEEVCRQLAKRAQGCRTLHLTVFRTDGEVASVSAATSQPSRDPAHLARLFEGKLEQIDPGFGFDLITLNADGIEGLGAFQTGLDCTQESGLTLPHLIDRLSARFGAKAVSRPVAFESHIPERAERKVAALNSAPMGETAFRERPIRILHRPEEIRVIYAVPEGPPAQFIWRRQTLKVLRYNGPERIAPEWWHDLPGTRLRDYYKVEDSQGRRFWLYREGHHEDGRGGDPRWFLHGMFA